MTTNTPAPTKPSLAQLIQQMRPEIARALPAQMNADRMARIATTVLRQTPALARTTPESFLGALLTASQLGLEPGPTGEAYLVPYGNVCTFIPGYRGLIKLARNSGQLRDIWAEVVYSNDTFRYSLGLHRDLVHEPASGPRGEPIYVYAAAELVEKATTDARGKSVLVSEAKAKFGPAVPNPEKLICVGLNYRQHAAETGSAIPPVPLLFNKPSTFSWSVALRVMLNSVVLEAVMAPVSVSV
jgi:phage RecT family recombinase